MEQQMCDAPLCDHLAAHNVSVPWGDRVWHLCVCCYSAYELGVQHGRLKELEGIKE